MAELHIAIKPETLFHIGGLPISNTLFTSFVITAVLLVFLAAAGSTLKKTDRPTGIQNFLEMVVESLVAFIESIAGKTARAVTFTPLIAGFFVFVLLNNWADLLPGFDTIRYTGEPGVKLVQVPNIPGISKVFAETTTEEVIETVQQDNAPVSATVEEEHAPEEQNRGVAIFRGANTDINMTLALALISVIATQYFGLRFQKAGYLKKYFDFSGPIQFFVGLLEILSEISKILSYAFRLFGNIFAGQVLLAVMGFLIPVLLPSPFYGLEIFVGFIQALVFSMLSLVYFNMAAESHHG